MSKKTINVFDDSSPQEVVKLKRRNVQGSKTVAVSITIPQELNQYINGKLATSTKSRSLIISELLKKGLRNE